MLDVFDSITVNYVQEVPENSIVFNKVAQILEVVQVVIASKTKVVQNYVIINYVVNIEVIQVLFVIFVSEKNFGTTIGNFNGT